MYTYAYVFSTVATHAPVVLCFSELEAKGEVKPPRRANWLLAVRRRVCSPADRPTRRLRHVYVVVHDRRGAFVL